MKTRPPAIFTCGAIFLSCAICLQGAPPRSIPLAHPDPGENGEAAGNYRIARDRVISIGPFSEAGNHPVFFDSKTRRLGVLYPISGTDSVTGTLHDGDMVTPADVRVSFRRKKPGGVSSLLWREGNAAPLRAIRVSPHRNEEVAFTNGDVTLRGTLTLPPGLGPYPAIVVLQEAGPRPRPFGFWPYLFARYGIATLTFDKRGSGASDGHWETASFDDLAGDALAAVGLLRSRPDIDRSRIGLWGNSNSGWVVPLAASRSMDVAFVISRVGSSLPPTENVLYEMENEMRGQGFSEDEIAKAVGLRRLLQNAIVKNTSWDQFIASAGAARGERWFAASRVGRYAAAPLPPDAATLRQWRNPLDFDPLVYWAQVRCPVLAIYGGRDRSTPTERNVPPLIDALRRAGNNDYTITVLPNADHEFYEYDAARQGYASAIPALERYVPGYVDGMMEWLSKRLRLSVE